MKKTKEGIIAGIRGLRSNKKTLLLSSFAVILVALATLVFATATSNTVDDNEGQILGAVDYIHVDVKNYPAGALISYETSSDGGMTWSGLTPLTNEYIIVNGGIDMVYIVVDTPAGYTFEWEDNPYFPQTATAFILNPGTGETHIKGAYTPIPQTVNLSITNPSWGSFTYILDNDGIIRSVSGSTFIVPYDSSVEIIASPNTGYGFKWSDLAVGVYSKTVVVTDNPTVVGGEFSRSDFSVYIDADPSVGFAYTGGTASGGDTVSVPFGTVVTIEAVSVPAGYTFAWENTNPLLYTVVNGTSSTIAFTVPAEITAVKGNLTTIDLDVTIVITNMDDHSVTGGKVYVETTDDLGIKLWKEVPNGQVLNVKHGTELKLKVIPAEGYEFECSLDAGTVYKWPAECLMPLSPPVTGNVVIDVSFSLIRYDVLLYTNNAAFGSIEYWDMTVADWLPYPSAGLVLPHFTNLELRVVAEEGYEFAWPFSGAVRTWEDGWVTFKLFITEDISEEIVFSLMEFDMFIDVWNASDCGTLAYSLTNTKDLTRSLTGATVPANGMIRVKYFDTVIVTAIPDHGYWMDWNVNELRRVSATDFRTDVLSESFDAGLVFLYADGEFKKTPVTVTFDSSGKGYIEYSLDGGATWKEFPEEGFVVLHFNDEVCLRSVVSGYTNFTWDSVSLAEANYVITDGVLTFTTDISDINLVGTFHENKLVLLLSVCIIIALLIVVAGIIITRKR